METKNKSREKPKMIQTITSSSLNIAKKTRDIVDADKVYSNRRDRKNKYSSSQEFPARTREKRKRNKKEFLYNGCE